ncbi:MAG: DUF502 domain-containing protein [Acidobacteriota bacterium]
MKSPSEDTSRRPPEPPPSRPLRARFRRLLLAGLLILTPVAVTTWVLVQLFRIMDGIFAPLVDQVLSRALQQEDIHVPGTGIALTLLVVLILGWLSTNVGGRRVLRFFERMLYRVPVASTIYGSTKGILQAVSRDRTEAFKRVVMVEYPKADIFALAFVTGNARWAKIDPRMDDLLLVFVPTTPNPTSGFLLLVPRQEAVELPITVEEGIRMVISGGLLLPRMEGPRGRGPLASKQPPDAAAQAAEGPRSETGED